MNNNEPILAIKRADLNLPRGMVGFFDIASHTASLRSNEETRHLDPNIFEITPYAVPPSEITHDGPWMALRAHVALRAVTDTGTHVVVHHRLDQDDERFYGKFTIGTCGLIKPVVPGGSTLAFHLADFITDKLLKEIDLKIFIASVGSSMARGFFYVPELTPGVMPTLGITTVLGFDKLVSFKNEDEKLIEALQWMAVEKVRDMAADGAMDPLSVQMLKSNIV